MNFKLQDTFADFINRAQLGAEKFMELNKPVTTVIDQSGQKVMVQRPGLSTGAPTTVGTYADVPLPADVVKQKKDIAGAGAGKTFVAVNAQLPASEEAQKEFMKSSRQTYDQLKTAPVLLTNIDEAIRLIPTAKNFTGPGGATLLQATSFLNNRLGTSIDTKGVTDATELRSRLFSGVIENLRKLDAQPTAAQQQTLQEAIGNLGTDPNALPRVLNAMGDSVRQKVEGYNQEVAGAEQRGVKFPYNPQIKLPQPKQSAPAPAAANQIPGQTPSAMYASNPQTGQRIMSTDGGKTWSPAR